MDLPKFTDYDGRVFVVLATSKNTAAIRRCSNAVLKRMFGPHLPDWADHFEDVFVHTGHTDQLVVLESEWLKLPEETQKLLISFCEGFMVAVD